jgi:hypothetical protein
MVGIGAKQTSTTYTLNFRKAPEADSRSRPDRALEFDPVRAFALVDRKSCGKGNVRP